MNHTGLMPRLKHLLLVALTLASFAPAQMATAAEYETFDEAYHAGVLFLNRNEDAKSQKPLEAALKLASDEKDKLKVYRALARPYSLHTEPAKMFEAIEFVIDKSESDAERSLSRMALMGYLQPRGATDAAIKRYETMLKKQPENKTALYILSEIFERLRDNPKRAAELGEKLAEVMKKEGGELNVFQSAKLAAQFVKVGKHKEGAELYERIAELDPKMAAWHWKEAAAAWLKAKNKEKALAAAKASSATDGEGRGDLLAHFWNRNLADIYLELGEAKLAIPHYEQAIEKTNIEGYIKDTKASLLTAQTKAGVTPSADTKTAGAGKKPGKTGKPAKNGDSAAVTAVDLNTATLVELTAVEGVTEDLAVAIIDHRKKKPFTSVTELIEFDGVDKALLAKLRLLMKVDEKK